MSRIKKQTVELAVLEKYGSLSDCFIHIAQKVDRETLKGMFSGEIGMGEI